MKASVELVMSIERNPSKFERTLLLTPVRQIIQHKYNVEVTRNDTIGLKPPYVILANHVTNWDPLFLNCYVDESISFVAAASTFQKPLMKKVLTYAGAIPKTKSQADSSTIRNIMKAIKLGRVVGIFPEGNRTWNGHTEPIVFSTAKLIRSLRVPVVVANIRGGYLSHPRWANTVRKSKVEVEFRKVLNGDELKGMTPEAVHALLVDELQVDDFQWQQQQGITFEGKQLAHHLERYLFTCPSCAQVGTLHSHDDLFTCQACQYEVRYTNIGTFEQMNEPLRFTHIYDWNEWQLAELAQRIEEPSYKLAIEQSLQQAVHLEKWSKDDVYEEMGMFTMHVYGDTFTFTPLKKGEPFTLQASKIDGANIFKQNIINFLYEGIQYHITLQNERASAYLFTSYVQQLKQLMTESHI